MSKQSKAAAKKLLSFRGEELLWCYRRHRGEADVRIVDASRYDGSTMAYFAAVEAALELAFSESLIDWQQHAWLSAVHVAFLGQCADDFSQCRCHIEAGPQFPSPAESPERIVAYEKLFFETRGELFRERGEVKGIYKAIRRLQGFDLNPYGIITDGVLCYAAWKQQLIGRPAASLHSHFAALGKVAELEEFGLREVAR